MMGARQAAGAVYGGVTGMIANSLNFTFSWRGLEYAVAKTALDFGARFVETMLVTVAGAGPLVQLAIQGANNALSVGLVDGAIMTPGK
jgi:hypothetical protein